MYISHPNHALSPTHFSHVSQDTYSSPDNHNLLDMHCSTHHSTLLPSLLSIRLTLFLVFQNACYNHLFYFDILSHAVYQEFPIRNISFDFLYILSLLAHFVEVYY